MYICSLFSRKVQLQVVFKNNITSFEQFLMNSDESSSCTLQDGSYLTLFQLKPVDNEVYSRLESEAAVI